MSSRFSIDYLHVDELAFDPDNPRRPATVDPDDERAVLAWLILQGSVLELMGSIGSYGFFPGEPLLVAPRENRLIVVEGNRRLAAAKLLVNPDLAPIKQTAVRTEAEQATHRESRVPTLRFESREEILDYLGYRHVTGVKEWPPLAKARYLDQLAVRHRRTSGAELPMRELARMIGSKSSYVGRLLTSLRAFDTLTVSSFFEKHGLRVERLPFSLMSTALNYPNVVSYLGLSDADNGTLAGLDEGALSNVAYWLFVPSGQTGKPLVPESRQIRVLNQVLGSKKATDTLLAGSSLREALVQTHVADDIFRQATAEAADRLDEARRQLPFLVGFTVADLEMAERVLAMSRELVERLRQLLDRLSAAR